MNSKLIFVGTISAAVGAVVSWAVTADYYDNKLKAVSEVADGYENLLRVTENKVYDLENGRVETVLDDSERTGLTDEIVLGTRAEAEDVISWLQELVSAHGVVTRADYFELVGLASNWEDTRYGWTDLDNVFLSAFADGVKIVFPPILKLDGDESLPSDEMTMVSEIDVISDDAAIPPGETLEETRTNLETIINDYIADEDDRDAFIGQAVPIPALRNEQPEIISREEFAYSEAYDHYDKQTLIYYPAHRLLLDEDEETVANIPYVVGWKNLGVGAFGGESGDPDTVFVSNHKMETDFEITRETDEAPPLHVQYGMSKEEYNTRRAAGLLRPPRHGREDT